MKLINFAVEHRKLFINLFSRIFLNKIILFLIALTAQQRVTHVFNQLEIGWQNKYKHVSCLTKNKNGIENRLGVRKLFENGWIIKNYLISFALIKINI